MSDPQPPFPLDRIDAALARIEAAAERRSVRHDRLRGEVERAVAALDQLMAQAGNG